jgi:hypothetical protein
MQAQRHALPPHVFLARKFASVSYGLFAIATPQTLQTLFAVGFVRALMIR